AAVAQYFGREWIAVQHRPAALLGFEALADGRIVFEVLAGLEAPIALPAALAAEEERAVDRWRGKEPWAFGARDPAALAHAVIAAVAAPRGAPVDRAELPGGLALAVPIVDAGDPVPPGLTLTA